MLENCWTQIGVRGDRSCPELNTVIHCQNCRVYSQAGRTLLERAAPDGYVSEWTTLLAQPREQGRSEHYTHAVTLFRLGQEWLALPASIFHQILAPSPIHTLPHCSQQVLRGLVNVRGQLLLCVSLHDLLSIAGTTAHPATPALALSTTAPSEPSLQPLSKSSPRKPGSYPRLAVIAQQQELWAFEVDEFYGLLRYHPDELRNVPALSNNTLKHFTQHILPWQTLNVSYLDPDRLFAALHQKAL